MMHSPELSGAAARFLDRKHETVDAFDRNYPVYANATSGYCPNGSLDSVHASRPASTQPGRRLSRRAGQTLPSVSHHLPARYDNSTNEHREIGT